MDVFDIKRTVNELVFSSLERVTAVELHRSGKAELFIRKDDNVESLLLPFSPFLIASEQALACCTALPCRIEHLNGGGFFNYLVEFDSQKDYESSVDYLKKNIKMPPSASGAQYRVITDMQQQLLIRLQIRLFRGMKFFDLRRFQFDIETLTTKGFDFSNPERPDDRIIVMSMRDSTGWEKCIAADDKTSEKDLIQAFVDAVSERDPDVLEGHNIFRFDLPFIETRARMHKIKLNLGRDGSAVKSRNSRFTAAEKTTSYKRYEAYGRHIADTYFLAQLYDISHRSLESYGLKSIALHFNVAPEGRTYIERGSIDEYFRLNPQELIKYSMDDVRETDAISGILSPSYFYQAQLQPFSYQNIITRGNATRIDAMLLAEYISRKESYSLSPDEPRSFEGALTEAFESGIFENIWHCDIRSLYPSIIISENINPSSDRLGVFNSMLIKLRDIRLKARAMEKSSPTRAEKDFYNSMQTAFKILINSFYGYLAFNQGTFNDYSAAEKVTSRGREILTMMLNHLKSSGSRVIEMDTDGIYFQPPLKDPGITPVAMQKNIQAQLPEGIEVELDSVYKKMFCYKSKNYALLSDSGEITITGAALKSRGVEPFIRTYLQEVISILLCSGRSELEKLTELYRTKLSERKFPLRELAKSETLSESPENYRAKLSRNDTRRSAAYELALKSQRGYKQGDQISYYVTGDKKKLSVVDNCHLLKEAPPERNENILYYVQKIEDLYTKFRIFAEGESKTEEFRLE